MPKRIHVVAAVIEDINDNIFIAKRPRDKHQGGLWEFPGGKVEPDEEALDALKRELHEEIGIDVLNAHPLIQVSHDYPDKLVLLDTWKVTEFSGKAHGKENQETKWVSKPELRDYSFPAANNPIITAAQLPQHYAITPQPVDSDNFYESIKTALENGVKLFQLRTKKSPSQSLIDKVVNITETYNAKVLINSPGELTSTLGTHGRHLTSKQLLEAQKRPISQQYWLAASCHNEEEIRHAEKIAVDFIVLAPVLDTTSHPGVQTLGWKKFQQLSQNCSVPVYALGGMQKDLLGCALNHGAQGLSGISLFFNSQ